MVKIRTGKTFLKLPLASYKVDNGVDYRPKSKIYIRGGVRAKPLLVFETKSQHEFFAAASVSTRFSKDLMFIIILYTSPKKGQLP